MFYKVVLKNFKGFDSFEIDFKEGKTKKTAKKLVLLYGENGIGKSSFVDAFQLLMDTCRSLIKIRLFNISLADDTIDADIFVPSSIERKNAYHIEYLIKNLKKISSNKPMELCFYGYDDMHNSFEYYMKFDSLCIIEETLISNKKIIFNIDSNKTLQNSISKNKEFIEKLEEYKNMYFGKHTLLSCIFYLLDDLSADFLSENLSANLLSFINEINLIDIFRPQSFNFESYSYIENDDLLPNLVRGVYKGEYRDKMDNTKKVLSNFFSSYYDNIEGVDYEIKEQDNGAKIYMLVFLEKTIDGIIKIPFALESTGTRKLVSLFTYFYQVFSKNMTSLIDEIDSGISISLLQRIVNNFDVNKFKGQLILTTHNLMLMKENWKKNIYIMSRDERFHVAARSLDSFKREVQPNTDIVGKYLKNKFGGVVTHGGTLFEDIIIDKDISD